MEQSYHEYIEKSKEVGRLFPSASKRTIKAISIARFNDNNNVGNDNDEEIDPVRMKCFNFYIGWSLVQQGNVGHLKYELCNDEEVSIFSIIFRFR